MAIKAVLWGGVGLVVFSTAWTWYFLKPGFNKATGMGAYRAAFGPWFWVLAVAVATASAALYYARR